MDNEHGHADRRFALFTPPPEDPDFARVRNHLFDTVIREAMRLRVKCARECGISIFETDIDITSDLDRPNFITLTARPRASGA